MSAIDDLIGSAVPRTAEVRVCARGDLAERHADLVRELERWLEVEGADSLAQDSNVHHIKDKLLEVEEEIDRASVSIRFQAIPAYKWATLMRLNPPSREDLQRGFDNNPDTFPIQAVAACSVEPTISVEQAEQLRNTLHTAEWLKCWMAVVLLNNEETPTPKLGAAIADRLASAQSSTPASDEESLAGPSSDGGAAQ